MRWVVIAAALGLLGVACSGGSQVVSLEDVDAADTGPGDARLAEGTGDAGGDGLHFDGPDGLSADGSGECLVDGGFGCPCLSDKDCSSGMCVQHMGDLLCTAPCVEECPGTGWSCQQYSGFGDPIFVCLSDYPNLCWPCAADADCKANGSNDVCVRYGGEESFCGGDCDQSGGCPKGYGCQTVTTVAGLETKQCVAVEGTCECTELAKAQQAWTPCAIDSRSGTCPGKRVCGEDGLAPCDAPIPVSEECNGIDDDCNGVVDGDGLCDDGSPCTEDSCAGKDGCQYVQAEDDTECVDKDLCTQKDRCQAGQCVGDPVVCVDGNECTLDECDPQTGDCPFLPDTAMNGAACGTQDKCATGGLCVDGECVGSKPLTCMDGVVCTLADCDPATGCLYTLDHTVCDDGNPCTVDLCQPQCEEPGNCLEGDGCVHEPEKDGTPCLGEAPGVVLACVAGQCSCVPQCNGKVCGDDGCGGSCGTCGYPKDLCWKDGTECIGLPCVNSSECGVGLYCDKTQDPAQCLTGCDSDAQCLAVCPAAGLHVCLPSNQCLCASGGWPGTAPLPAENGCLMAGDGWCISADRFVPVDAPQDGMKSASGKFRIESTLWQ